MVPQDPDQKHAALWLIGPDVPGLLHLGSKFVADRGGNIDKDIADKFGEKCVVFMSVTAPPKSIHQMLEDVPQLKKESGCGVVFQPMKDQTVPDGFRDDLHGFDIVTDDAPGMIAEMTSLMKEFGVLIAGHTGERRMMPGPRREIKAGQKFIVMLPHAFEHGPFNLALEALVKRYNGKLTSPLRPVPGLLWWW